MSEKQSFEKTLSDLQAIIEELESKNLSRTALPKEPVPPVISKTLLLNMLIQIYYS